MSFLPVGAVASTGLTAVTPSLGQSVTGGGFGQALTGAIQNLAQSGEQANALEASYLTGNTSDLGQMMVAMGQADLETQGAATVMTKALSSYQAMMQMQV